VLPLTRSASGGLFVAFLPEEMTAARVRKELADNARKGLQPATPEEFERALARTRRQGFAHTSEFIPGIAGIAAPVLDHSGAMVLALIVLGYTKPFEAAVDAISAATLRKAAALSARLGWRPAA
jgi:DNA-binding IclR family transcriptional regulator